MKPEVNCVILGPVNVGERVYVHRTSDHPVLGPPNSRTTHTSKVLSVDYEKGVIETLNTLYKFK